MISDFLGEELLNGVCSIARNHARRCSVASLTFPVTTKEKEADDFLPGPPLCLEFAERYGLDCGKAKKLLLCLSQENTLTIAY